MSEPNFHNRIIFHNHCIISKMQKYITGLWSYFFSLYHINEVTTARSFRSRQCWCSAHLSATDCIWASIDDARRQPASILSRFCCSHFRLMPTRLQCQDALVKIDHHSSFLLPIFSNIYCDYFWCEASKQSIIFFSTEKPVVKYCFFCALHPYVQVYQFDMLRLCQFPYSLHWSSNYLLFKGINDQYKWVNRYTSK